MCAASVEAKTRVNLDNYTFVFSPENLGDRMTSYLFAGLLSVVLTERICFEANRALVQFRVFCPPPYLAPDSHCKIHC